MQSNIITYVNELTDSVYEKISIDICDESITEVVLKVMKHTKGKLFKFHEYYIKISDKLSFASTDNFFRDFKRMYALQGISNHYLDEDLEIAKSEILMLIEQNKLSELYFKFFAKAEIQKEGNEPVIKSLGSFFTKLVHTFNPKEYCALDNPIKEYFNLKNESFYLSFIIISEAYKKWIKDNDSLLSSVRKGLKGADKENHLNLDNLTDLKLLDMIFWTNANKPS